MIFRPTDRMLARLARSPVAPWRRWAARRAAARALHGVGLAAAGDDAAVLAMLGLHGSPHQPPIDASSRAGALVSRLARGEAVDPAALAGLGEGWRRRAVAVLAPRDPATAAKLAADAEARAACLIAAGRDAEAGAVLTGRVGREAETIRAAIAVRRGDWLAGRAAIDAMLGADGLSPVLAEGQGAFDIASLGGLPVIEGGGDAAALVSVVMPYRDAAATLAMAAGSILRQGWRAIELILIDDGSADGGPGIAQALAAADPRVRPIVNRAEPGVAGARNSGIAAATGRYVAFLDADDWSHPDRIARQMAAVGNAPASVSRHIRMGPDGAPVAPRVTPIVRLCPISMLIRREAIEAAGPFAIMRTGSDAEYLARIDLLFGRRAVPRDPAVLTIASWRPGSLSSDPRNSLADPARFAEREGWMREHADLWLERQAAGGLPIEWRRS